ncbi:hypothetical protein BLA3211_01122 [Burkholderia aenigmatica]|uniref:Uncharacterized protein n=1 Tax=Burkholderia aenigmatica TaxID=2015348 RepID=A0A6J5IPP9_9BURK|nr:hypothetical protein BLA3211_01122 [Burkholderia aenigmatica]
MSRCYTWRAVSKYDECVCRPRRSRACRAAQGCRRCDDVRARRLGTGEERVVRSAKVCRDDMRRHICRPIHARFVSSRVTRIERTQYATCDWNRLLRNREPPALTIRRIDFLPIGNGSVRMSRSGLSVGRCHVVYTVDRLRHERHVFRRTGIHAAPNRPRASPQVSMPAMHDLNAFPSACGNKFPVGHTCAQPQPGPAPVRKRRRAPCTT